MTTFEPSSQYMRMVCEALYIAISIEPIDSTAACLLYDEIRARDRPFYWLLKDKEASRIVYSALQKYDVDASSIPNSGGVWTNIMKELRIHTCGATP